MKTYKKLRIFLASPEDIRKDREHVKKLIGRINQEISDDRGLILEAKDWHDVAPDMDRPETVILDQLPVEEWDLLIGIVWHRFGTPSGGFDPASGRQFESGTEEEFKTAYARWQRMGKPRIMFYRCMRKYDPRELNPDQLKRVDRFFRDFGPNGRHPGLARQYTTVEELKDLVRLHLNQHLQKLTDPPRADPARVFLKGKELIMIPAGRFLMGCSYSHAKFEIKGEYPAHEVDLDAYYISRHLVTNEDYQAFVDEVGYPVPYRDDEVSTPYNWDRQARRCPAGKGNHPVVLVSWHDAQSYCRWLGTRLPTEAEWEKAARGTDGREWPWGSTWHEGWCNAGGSGLPGTSAVGSFSPQSDSPYGISDMAGNVWEWCSSLLEPYPYQVNDGRETSESLGQRVLRGGSFRADGHWVRCTLRNNADSHDYGFNIGFRVAISCSTVRQR